MDDKANPSPNKRARPFAELSDSGILWKINRTVFHPLGYALALHVDNDTGEAMGWSIRGDGSEPFVFTNDDDDKLFSAAEATLAALRDSRNCV
jgi:hypothetical protein